ncbi:hypothetical protein BD310DRAFT_397314 [Dichomitus squalens]|uniref:Uncharacterized protein n=1 Tax=Dichomitus squalens TaxID=114155 RepID=A0A4Q9QA48_9APHY|nr:hypothetical protein BD310DRAFT_397314 [Dichomitus squalens]
MRKQPTMLPANGRESKYVDVIRTERNPGTFIEGVGHVSSDPERNPRSRLRGSIEDHCAHEEHVKSSGPAGRWEHNVVVIGLTCFRGSSATMQGAVRYVLRSITGPRAGLAEEMFHRVHIRAYACGTQLSDRPPTNGVRSRKLSNSDLGLQR